MKGKGQEDRCSFCNGESAHSLQMPIGVPHPARDQKDTSRYDLLRFCEYHWKRLNEKINEMGRKR